MQNLKKSDNWLVKVPKAQETQFKSFDLNDPSFIKKIHTKIEEKEQNNEGTLKPADPDSLLQMNEQVPNVTFAAVEHGPSNT